MATDNIDKLYDALKADGILEKDRETFRKYMLAPGEQGYKNRVAIYNTLKADEYVNSATYEDFSKALGLTGSPKPATAPAQQTTAQPSSASASAQSERTQAAARAQSPVQPVKAQSAQTMVPPAAAPAQPVQASQPAKEPEPKRWQPSVQDRIRMQYVRDNRDVASRRTRDTLEQIGRVRSRMTQKGRDIAKAAEFQARTAGVYTKPIGLSSPYSSSASASAQTGSEGKRTVSPMPYGVSIVDGKPEVEWLLPDGRLTTDFTEADQAEFGARGTRLRDQFVDRMRENGLDPAKAEDIEMQAQYDAQAPAYKVVADLWKEAEEKYKKDRERNAEREWDSYNALGGGRELRYVHASANRQADQVAHLTRFDLEKMMDRTWKQVGGKIYDNCYIRLQHDNPGASEKELHDAAAKMARTLTDNAVYQYAVEKNTPKSTMEFFGRTVADMNVISSLGKAFARSQADTSGDMAANDAATAEFAKHHRVAQVGGTVVGMAIDPVTWISGGVGSLAGKGAMWTGGRILARFTGTSGQVATRYLGTTLSGRLLGGLAGGAANLGTYEALKEGERQLKYGGYINPETGQNEGYSAEAIWKQAGHGAGMGVLIGWVGPVVGNVFDPLVKSATSTGGKIALRGGEQASSALFEGTIFAAPDYISMRSMSDEDFDKQYAREYGYASLTDPVAKAKARRAARSSVGWDIWNDSMAMMLGFKAQHGIKSAYRTVRDMAPYDPAKLGRPLTMQEIAHNRQSFQENLRKALDKSPGDIAMTDDEIEELRNAGYGKLAGLFRKGDSTVKEVDPSGKERVIGNAEDVEIKYGPDEETFEGVKKSDFDGYDTMARLMNDNNVSEAARAKAYFILTGRRLPESTIMGYRTVEDEKGNIVVQSMSRLGSVVTSRRFSSKEKAQQEITNLQRQIELNSIEIGERFKTKEIISNATQAACEEVADRHGEGWTAEGVAKAYDQDVKDKESGKEIGQDSEALMDEVEAALESHMEDFMDELPEAIREEINRQRGVDLDKVLRKPRKKREVNDQAAVEDYLKRLYPEEVREDRDERNKTEGQRAAESAHDAGYNMTDQTGREEVLRNYRYQKRRMSEKFGADDVDAMLNEEFRTSDMSRIYDRLGDSRFNKEEQAMIMDYLRARDTMMSVSERMDDDIEARIRKETEFMGKTVHEDGNIRPATMKGEGRQVYIIKGNVEVTDDGMINTAKSDDVIYVYDPETDKVKQTSPILLGKLGEVTDAEEARQEMERMLREQDEAERRKASGYIDTFNPGDRFTVDLGEDFGGPREITVTGMDEEGQVTFEMDGTGYRASAEYLSDRIDEYRQMEYESRYSSATTSAQKDSGLASYGDPDNAEAGAQEQTASASTAEEKTGPQVPVSMPYEQGDELRVVVSGSDRTQHAAVVDHEGDTVMIWSPFAVNERSEKSKTMSGYTTELTEAELDGLLERDTEGQPVGYVGQTPAAGAEMASNDEEAVIHGGIEGTGEGLKEAFAVERERIGNEWLDDQGVQEALRAYAEESGSIEELVERAKADSNDERTRQRLDTLLEFDSTRQKLRALLHVPNTVETVPTSTETPQNPTGNAVSGAKSVPETDIPVGNVQVSETLTPLQRIPRDAKGEPVFEEAESPEQAWDALVEMRGGDVGKAQVVADMMAESKRKAYEKVKKQTPKGNTPSEIMASQDAIDVALAQAEREYNHWLAMAGVERDRQEAAQAEEQARQEEAARIQAEREREEAERKVAEEAERKVAEEVERKALMKVDKRFGEVYDQVKGSDAAVERLKQMEPEDIREAAAMLLAGGRILWDSDGGSRGFKQETGYGEGERRKLFGLFATKEKGGRSLRKMSEDEMKELCDQYGIQYDNMEAMNALLDVLGSARVPSDIRNYIKNRRMEQALAMYEQEEAHERALYAEWCQEAYGMSIEDYEAREENMLAEAEKAYENFDEMEYFGNIADEIKSQENGIREHEGQESEGEGAGYGGGGEVLSAQGVDPTEGTGADARGQGVPEGDGDQVGDPARSVPEGASGGEVAPSRRYDRTVPATREEQCGAIARIIDFAKRVKNRVERAVIGGITKRQARDFAEQGIEVDETWVHSFESSAVSHNQKHHGSQVTEDARGQVAITADDYNRIPDILEGYDRVSKSPNKTKGTENEVIIYEKEFEDWKIQSGLTPCASLD